MQNTTLEFLQQLTPTQSLALIAAVLAISCVAWMSIRLLGTLARLALIAGAAALLVSASGILPGLETSDKGTFEALNLQMEPLFAELTTFVDGFTSLTFMSEEARSAESLNDDAAVQTILSQNDGPSGHSDYP